MIKEIETKRALENLYGDEEGGAPTIKAGPLTNAIEAQNNGACLYSYLQQGKITNAMIATVDSKYVNKISNDGTTAKSQNDSNAATALEKEFLEDDDGANLIIDNLDCIFTINKYNRQERLKNTKDLDGKILKTASAKKWTTKTNKTAAFLETIFLQNCNDKKEDKTLIETTIKEYAELLNIKDIYKAAAMASKEINLLKLFEIKGFDVINSKYVETESMSFYGGYSKVRGGKIAFRICKEWAEMLEQRCNAMPIPKALFATNDNEDPHAWPMGYKMLTHAFMNNGRPNSNTISFYSLVKSDPKMPDPETVSEGNNRAIYRRLVEPVIITLARLEARYKVGHFAIYWKGGPELTKEEVDELANRTTKQDFLNLCVNFQFKDYPAIESNDKKQQKD